jgi:NAD(P)H dehydrogenase (quinone)
MHVLLVYVHPEPTSFTAALKNTALEALRDAGHTVEVSDLYGEGFNPVAGRHDFQSAADPARFHYQTEQGHAHKTGSFAPDIVREHQRFTRADLVVWLYPIWWGNVPAILKGWFDRVLAYGFAYSDGKRYDSGFFRDKKGILCLTSGGTRERFSANGVYGEMHQVLWSVQRLALNIWAYRRSNRSSPMRRRASIRRRGKVICRLGERGSWRLPVSRRLPPSDGGR